MTTQVLCALQVCTCTVGYHPWQQRQQPLPLILTHTLWHSAVMTSSKQCIVWTAVLLYHRLKVAARTNNRYRLNSKIISTEVIHRLALYYKKSTESICNIVGVNGRNTKGIYNRLVGQCQTFEIENCICKKADQRIFNNNTTTAIIIQQSQSPGILSDVQQVHNILVCITYNNKNSIICNNNNTTSFSEQNNHKKCVNLSLQTTISYMNRRSSSCITTKKSLSFSKQLIIVPKHLEFEKKQWIWIVNPCFVSQPKNHLNFSNSWIWFLIIKSWSSFWII